MEGKFSDYRYVILLLLFPNLFQNFEAFAQKDSLGNPFFIGIKADYGFIIPHSEPIRSISYSRPRGFAIDAGWLLLGQRAWDYCYCYPESGISFSFTDFNNPEILGRSKIYGLAIS